MGKEKGEVVDVGGMDKRKKGEGLVRPFTTV